MYWERLEESLGRMSLVDSLVKKRDIPLHLASDEKISFHNGKVVYIGLTSSQESRFILAYDHALLFEIEVVSAK
jgi:hypothetical protein